MVGDELQVAVRRSYPLANATLIKVGGPAEYFLQVGNAAEMRAALAWVRARGLPHYVIGNGSNLVVSDAGIEGAVIRFVAPRPEYRLEGRRLTVSAGTSWPSICRRMARAGLGGLEAGLGIPGTIGGAICMHAGVPESTIADALRDVRVVRASDGREFLFTREQMHFGDRSSRVLLDPDLIVLGARFDLWPVDPARSREALAAAMAERRASQPYHQPNAGCMFRREPGVLPGKLIDECGLKGLRVGDAAVSELHANFIVNLGRASARDVDELAERVASEVYRRSGVRLRREVQFIGRPD